YGDGGELRDFLFVEDVARAAIRFAFEDGEGTYNAVTGESVSFGEILDCLRAVTGEDFEILRMERNRPRIDQRFDPAKLMAALPGFRFTPLEEGLRRTFEDFKKQFSGGERE
ncbi:MAG TPA: hypothetical protein DDZ83_02750, partial [Nitrospinae bacterium]|nr:hypothetical protein [Nitrospinota bacterium]